MRRCERSVADRRSMCQSGVSYTRGRHEAEVVGGANGRNRINGINGIGGT